MHSWLSSCYPAHAHPSTRPQVAVYFKRFDEAEQLYHKMDRPDLAVDMRMRLGAGVLVCVWGGGGAGCGLA